MARRWTEPMVGRTAELTSLQTFLAGDGDPTGGRGLRIALVRGDEGQGKTALWTAATAELELAGFAPVLQAAPVAAEAQLEQVVLHDLLDQCPPDAFGPLPEVARTTLEVVRLLRPAERPVGRREIGTAVLDLLRHLAGVGRPVIALDDLHLVDTMSARTLTYVLRRAADLDVAFLATWSTGAAAVDVDVDASPAARGPGDDWQDLLDTVGVPVHVVTLAPLEPAEIEAVVRLRLGTDLTSAEVAELHHHAGGNPSVALELVQARRSGDPGRRGDELSAVHGLPRSWERARLVAAAEMGRRTGPERQWLQALSLAHSHTRGLADRLGHRLGVDEWADVVPTTLLAVDGATVRFRHPLLREAVAASVGPDEGRELHALLATVEESAEGRALHRMAADDGPDPELADLLEAAAAGAVGRGARHLGAQLWLDAARCTPADLRAGRRRRLMEAAARLYEIADPIRARAAAAEAGDLADDPSGKSAALLFVAQTHAHGYAITPAAVQACEEAATIAPPGSTGAAFAHLAAALFSCRPWSLGEATRHLAAAEAIDTADRRLQLTRTSVGAFVRYAAELRCDTEAVVATIRQLDDPWFSFLAYAWGFALMAGGQNRVASELLAEVMDRWRDAGVPLALPSMLIPLAVCEFSTGRLAEALVHADAALVRTEQREPDVANDARASVAVALLRLGRFGRAHAEAAAATTFVLDAGSPWSSVMTSAALANLWLADGHPERALTVVDGLRSTGRTAAEEPLLLFWVGPAVEGLALLGREDEAVELRDLCAAVVESFDFTMLRSQFARASALLAAADGRRDEALSLMTEAIDQAGRYEDPWLASLRRLQAAELARRLRRPREARQWAAEAEAGFLALGAAGWVARAGPAGGRPAAPAGAEAGRLTSAENDVAALVAEGLSNRTIAEKLHVSVKTVERHLTSAYRKVNASSRTALAAWYLRSTE